MASALGDQTKAENMEMVKVVNYLDSRQGNVNEPFDEVPLELWKKIFDEFGKLYKNPDERNRNFAALRRVSDKWGSVIDDHIDFTMTFTNALLSTPLETLSHVRFRTLVVSIATTIIHPKKMFFFLKPEMLSSYQPMNKANNPKFLKLVQAVKGVSECLHVKQRELKDWDNSFEEITPQQPNTLKEFWDGFTNLNLDIPYVDIKRSGSWDVINLKLFLKIVHLPKLREFKLRTTWRTMLDSLSLSFLSRHHSSVKDIHLNLDFQKTEMRLVRSYQQQPFTMSDIQDLEKIQFDNVTFEGVAICQVGRDTWISLLKLQRNLRRLTIMDPYRTNPFSFSDLAILIKQNYLTLTTLQVMIHFGGEVNLKAFQNMKCLKTLALQKNRNKNFAKIVNANCLPASLEKLIIHKLSLGCPSLTQIARSPQLTKLKHLELSEIGLCGKSAASTCIPIEVVYQFIEKESLEVLDLCPVQRRVKPNTQVAGGQRMNCGRLLLRLLPRM